MLSLRIIWKQLAALFLLTIPTSVFNLSNLPFWIIVLASLVVVAWAGFDIMSATKHYKYVVLAALICVFVRIMSAVALEFIASDDESVFYIYLGGIFVSLRITIPVFLFSSIAGAWISTKLSPK